MPALLLHFRSSNTFHPYNNSMWLTGMSVSQPNRRGNWGTKNQGDLPGSDIQQMGKLGSNGSAAGGLSSSSHTRLRLPGRSPHNIKCQRLGVRRQLLKDGNVILDKSAHLTLKFLDWEVTETITETSPNCLKHDHQHVSSLRGKNLFSVVWWYHRCDLQAEDLLKP